MERTNNSNKNTRKSSASKIGIALVTIIILVVIGVLLVMRFLFNYQDPWNQKVADAGYVEKTVQIGDVTFNYVEGPDNGPSLLLLHAQHMEWFSYNRVLPALSENFHVFAVDYHGHGQTISTVERYNAVDMGNDLAAFMETVIGEPAFVTGNSSGGLLTAWLAANRPDLVMSIVLEDPPLFSSEYSRIQETISYRSFTTCNAYIVSGEESDFLVYWLNSNAAFVARNAGEDALPRLLWFIDTYRQQNPDAPLEIPFLPRYIRAFMRGMDHYDPYFGNAFYDGTWNEDYDHAETLQQITQPTLLLHANFEITEDGILNGAMTQEEADLAVSLIPNVEYLRIDSAHTVHLDKPEEFVRIIEEFFLGQTSE